MHGNEATFPGNGPEMQILRVLYLDRGRTGTV